VRVEAARPGRNDRPGCDAGDATWTLGIRNEENEKG
jgi:hypothetical protein